MHNFIEWEEIKVRGNESGVKKTTCPNCSESRKKKSDPCLYVNFTSGVAKCYNCESLSFRDSSNENDYSEKYYELPKQNWKNYTTFSDKMVRWIESTRKISQSTLLNLNVTEEKYYQPSLQKEVNNIVFNYFEGEQVVNKKYRSANKKFTQSKGTKNIFYNINSTIGAKEVYIVEGEFDVLALYEFGVKNAISVPNGATDNDDYWKNSEPYLQDIEKFIIAVDNDEKGNILKDKIAQRLGRYRCEFIEWQNKDANGDLIADCLEESLRSRKQFPVSGTFKVKELEADILALFENGLPDTIYPKHKCFGNLKKIFSVMKGHVCTITGIPSHGKSNFSEWYILNLIKDYKMKCSFFSPEHSPMALHQTNFIQKAVGKPFFGDADGIKKVTREDILRYTDWANEKLYITAPEQGEMPTWDWILEKFKEQVYSYGIDIFVIDAFNKLELPSGNQREEINRVLTRITSFAQANNVLIFLVAHPTKMKKNEQTQVYDNPTLYDVSGSADFRNQTHDGFSVYRYFADENQNGYTTFTNLKTKLSFQGEIGQSCEFDYHIPTGRYFQRGTEAPLHDLTRNEEEQTIIRKEPVIEQNLDFLDEIADCPF